MINLTPFMSITYMVMITSTLMAISSSNWLMLWLALELNLLSFIPIMLNSNSNQETEASIKYFMAQAIGSSLLIMSTLMMWSQTQFIQYMNLVLILSLTIKIGLVPCHLWYPSVMTSISWNSAMLLSTWQKLAPLMILSYLAPMSKSLIPLATMNALMGGVMGMNQSQLRTIMAYSSITHLGWILGLMSNNMSLLSMLYFLVYIILITPIFIMLNADNIKLINQLNKPSMSNNTNMLTLSLLFISLGGLPPFLGFFPKLMTIFMLSQISLTLTITLIIGSLMNLYFYMNIIFSSILSHSPNNQFMQINTLKPFMMFSMATMTMFIPLIMMM